MNQRTAEQLAAIVGGEAWNSGGNIWLVTVTREDGSLVVFGGDTICEYRDYLAFEAGTAITTILMDFPYRETLAVRCERYRAALETIKTDANLPDAGGAELHFGTIADEALKGGAA